MQWYTQSGGFIGIAENVIAAEEDIRDITFSLLQKIEQYRTEDGKDITGYPPEILELDGKKVRIMGHFLLPMMTSLSEPCKEFGVSQYGISCPCCSNLPPPTQFNTIIVKDDGEGLLPIFSPYIEVVGIFRCKKEYYQIGEEKGLAAIFFIEGQEYKKIEPNLWEKIIGNRKII